MHTGPLRKTREGPDVLANGEDNLERSGTMDWYAPFQQTKRALPRIFMAGVISVAFGCAHHQNGDGHHADISSHHQHGSAAKAASSGSGKVLGTSELAEQMGIEVVSLRTTAGGHMLDLRYRVVDVDKAHQVLKVASKIDVVVIDKVNDVVAQVPQTMLGKLRGKSGIARTDRVYYVIFGNPHQMIQSGGSVDIQFGDVTVSGWPVM